MIDLSKPTLQRYKDRVEDIYEALSRNPWCSLRHFERSMRQISILNAKILSIRRAIKSSEIQKEE